MTAETDLTTETDPNAGTDPTAESDLTAVHDGAPVVPADADELAFDAHDLPGGPAAALEAILMVADEPIPAVQLASALALPRDEVEALLGELAAEYRGERGGRPRGFEVREAGGGWRVYSAPAFSDVVGRFVLEGQTARLTQAALETLSVVAYRQPVTRGQVSAVRGVNVDGVMRTLTTRGLVAEVGQDPSTGAIQYGTTGYFLERMGFTSLDELPPLAPHLPDMASLDDVDGFDRPKDLSPS
ncbi:condensin subunit ScpB [Sediminihabitans luteus]|uniref:Condensin subunit ScpB n=1 Tax=Sediminihabitans luteus TaxID=1138585 RepID=A0A2M9CQT8_9CELL|nr:SMC-Scp complex subunit ScpB [Sediminihabitans luteus]PJJ74292.1 condensin subunit ScpB [Sediminihabitans luteus]GII99145.1 segregation and condensation protein B [Sediminihabitans luteus]